MRRFHVLLGWVVAAVCGASQAEFDPATWPTDAELPTRQAIVDTLPNGVTYVVERWAEGDNEDRAYVAVMVQTGSIYETEEEAGYAHFVEHVVFRGSKGQSQKKTERFLREMGIPVALHGQGGSTALDQTMYSLPIPEAPAKHLARALGILAARVSRPLFRSADIEAERDIVLAEEQQRRASPAARERQAGTFGADHPLVTKSPIGSRTSLEDATVEGLKAFFERWYRTDRMFVVVVGDIDPEASVRLVRKSFGRLKKPAGPALPVTRVGPPTGLVEFVIEDPKVEVRRLGLSLMKPYERVDTVTEYYRSGAAAMGLDIVRSRLRDFRDATPYLTNVGLYASSMLDIQTTSLSLVADDGYELNAMREVLGIVRSAVEDGFTPEEIATAKALQRQRLKTGEEVQFRVPSGSIGQSWLGSLHRGRHPTETAAYLATMEHNIDRVHPEHIRLELARLFDAERRALVATVPEGEALVGPLEDFVAEVAFIDALELQAVEPGAKHVPQVASGDATDPFALPGLEPKAVKRTVHHDEVDVVQWSLPNGVEVLFKHDPEPNTSVNVLYRSPGGMSLLDDYDLVRSQLAREVISASGLRGLKSSALANLFRLHRTSANVMLAEDEHGFRLATFPDEMDFAFRALHLVATEAEVTREAFDSFVAKSRNVLTATVENPGFQFNAAVSDVIWPGRKLSPGSIDPALLDDVTPDWIRALYTKLFDHAGGTYVLISGPVEASEVKGLVERYVATLPGGTPRKPGEIRFPLTDESAEVRHRTNPDDRSVGNLYFLEREPGFDEYANFVRNAYASVLTSRLVKEIREERALVYSISARADSPRYPRPHGVISVSYVADPERVAEIETAILEVVRSLPKDVRERDLKPIRKSLRRAFDESLEKPAIVLLMLHSKMLQNLPLPDPDVYRMHIEDLNVDAVTAYGNKVRDTLVLVRTEYGPAEG